MGFFKRNKNTDEHPKVTPQADDCDPAPLLGRVGDGHTLESGERIARELRELQEFRHRRDVDVDTDAHVSGDPEMPIPDPGANKRDR
jgi:hypothetical protein